MEYIIWCLLGTVYGAVIGIIPIAGATTGLLTVYAFSDYFVSNPYLGVVFMTSLIASSSTGDSFTSILTGIPGSNTTAASVLDGYPMAKQGQAGRALGIAIMDSTLNGVLWGIVAFAFLPFYSKLILAFGIPELTAFILLSLCCVGLITSKNHILSVISIVIGITIGLIGMDPRNGAPRMTFGWDYLNAGIQILPIIAGLYAAPELIEGWKNRHYKVAKIENYWVQLFQGFRDCITHWRDMFRSGFIGFITGLLPGVGGSIGDLVAYGATVSRNPKETFGNGNPKGLMGCEGANNAQKAASMLPSILFGIPAAPFAAVMMAVCSTMGMYFGTPALVNDTNFMWAIGVSFIASSILVGIISMFTTNIIVKILQVPFWIYAVVISAVVTWGCMEYTGGIEDVYILLICCVLGIVAKYTGLSRPAIMLSFIVAGKLENYGQQTFTMYSIEQLVQRPMVVILVLLSVFLVGWSLIRKNKGLNYN
jgi:putative tricarboxylic transport membrane protein